MSVASPKRVVETSRGWLVVEVREDKALGVTVDAAAFGSNGLEIRSRTWTANHGHNYKEEPLDEFLSWLADLPVSEAKGLARRAYEEWLPAWHASGGPAEWRGIEVGVRALLAGLGGLIVLAVLGLAAIIGLLVWLVVW